MKISYRVNGILNNFESKVDLKLNRNRNDFKSLLLEIESGKNLEQIFGSTALANSLEKILKSRGLIDASNKLTKSGKDFIVSPLLEEVESGTYSIDYVSMPIGNETVNYFSAMRRTISNEKRNFSNWNISNIVVDNQMLTDRKDECVFFKELALPKQLKSVFQGQEKTVELNVDLVEKKYNVEKGSWLFTGDELFHKVLTYADEALKNNPYGRFDLMNNLLYVETLKDFSDKELVSGQLENYSSKGITVNNYPLCIDQVVMAKQYAYLYMYYRLNEDATYSFKEMDEILQNEVLTKNIFTDSVKSSKTMLEFQFDFNGFKDNLDTEKFNNLAYKLRVLEEFLDLKIVDNEFSKAKNYKEIVSKFATSLSGSTVNELFMVMGYPFAKNGKTKTSEMIQEFAKEYQNITIVKKGNEHIENEDIEKKVRSLGVKVRENKNIKKAFHDRYLVFELTNKTYEVYLITCEIGQFFNSATNQPLGSIIKINPNEVSKDNVNLIHLVKE